jgi:hypothetical protein
MTEEVLLGTKQQGVDSLLPSRKWKYRKGPRVFCCRFIWAVVPIAAASVAAAHVAASPIVADPVAALVASTPMAAASVTAAPVVDTH